MPHHSEPQEGQECSALQYLRSSVAAEVWVKHSMAASAADDAALLAALELEPGVAASEAILPAEGMAEEEGAAPEGAAVHEEADAEPPAANAGELVESAPAEGIEEMTYNKEALRCVVPTPRVRAFGGAQSNVLHRATQFPAKRGRNALRTCAAPSSASPA